MDKNLYSTNLSAKALISSVIMSEVFPASFSCSEKFYLSQSSLQIEDKNLVFVSFGFEENFLLRGDVIPKAETTVAGDLRNLIGELHLVLFIPKAISSNYISFANSDINDC